MLLGAILTLTSLCSVQSLVQLSGKQLLRGKVFGMGYSVPAKSLAQCMETCNKRNASCDGIVYHEIIKKCRMMKKCAAASLIDNSTSAVYYSKRPLIPTNDYLYVQEADSCFGLLPKEYEYEKAEAVCSRMGGRLALIRSRRSNMVASKLIARDHIQWAWMGENSNKNSVIGVDGFVPSIVKESNETTTGCLVASYAGVWNEMPCRGVKFRGICEILPFPS